MKSYFIRMFRYDRHANFQILELMAGASYPENPVRLMAHLLGSQQVWLTRCKGMTSDNSLIWPGWQADRLSPLIEENHRAWLAFIESLDDKDWDKVIAYRNSKGISLENKLSDILAHVINHGTHHRAQIGQHLKRPGENLPATDYIFYIWQL